MQMLEEFNQQRMLACTTARKDKVSTNALCRLQCA